MPRSDQKAQKPIKAWGGFSDGEIHSWRNHAELAVYRNRKSARADYEDVRPVWITFTEPKGEGDG